MNIVIFGAGALGSFFGGMLAKKHTVVLIGRKQHCDMVQKNGLYISGKTQGTVRLQVFDSMEKVSFFPDLILLTVKSYDTRTAVQQIQPYLKDDTMVLTLQNGLGNVELIAKNIPKKHIIAGITTQGVLFLKPGHIMHTGIGKTVLGEISGKKTERIITIANMFSEVGMVSSVSENIFREIWVKAVINSSINPLTAVLECKNGYLLENPLLENIVEKICSESVRVAQGEIGDIRVDDLMCQTKEVIQATKDNFSSMVQSIQQGKKTEIYQINGKLVEYGKKNGVDTRLNEFLVSLIDSSVF